MRADSGGSVLMGRSRLQDPTRKQYIPVEDGKRGVFGVIPLRDRLIISCSHGGSMQRASLLLTILSMLSIAAKGGEETIWVEGENPAQSTFVKHGWYDAVKKDVLSGGNWLSHYGPQPGEASWSIDPKEGGDYVFWVRCNT